jgi:hypothetical protein
MRLRRAAFHAGERKGTIGDMAKAMWKLEKLDLLEELNPGNSGAY